MFEQQLTQWLGSAERATYASWLLMAIGGLFALYLLILVIRVLMRGRINMSRSDRRSRQPRLGVTDFFDIDKEGRRLVIVRRDNVEHLIMIGGPNTDMVIESNIVRGMRGEIGAAGDGQVRPTIPLRPPEQIEPPAPQAQLSPPVPVAPPKPVPMPPQPVAAPPVASARPPAPPLPAAPQARPAAPAPAVAAPAAAPRPAPAPPAQPAAPMRADPPMSAAPVATPPQVAVPGGAAPVAAPVRPAASSALNSVTERLNANLRTIIPPTKISPKPADPVPQPSVATADSGTMDLDQEMARLLGKPGGGP